MTDIATARFYEANGKVYCEFVGTADYQAKMRLNVRASHTIMSADLATAANDLTNRIEWLELAGQYAGEDGVRAPDPNGPLGTLLKMIGKALAPADRALTRFIRWSAANVALIVREVRE